MKKAAKATISAALVGGALTTYTYRLANEKIELPPLPGRVQIRTYVDDKEQSEREFYNRHFVTVPRDYDFMIPQKWGAFASSIDENGKVHCEYVESDYPVVLGNGAPVYVLTRLTRAPVRKHNFF